MKLLDELHEIELAMKEIPDKSLSRVFSDYLSTEQVSLPAGVTRREFLSRMMKFSRKWVASPDLLWGEDLGKVRRRIYEITGKRSESAAIAFLHKAKLYCRKWLEAEASTAKGSGHYKFPLREKRLKIVMHLRRDQAAGNVLSKAAWADAKYGISSKALLRYEREFEGELENSA